MRLARIASLWILAIALGAIHQAENERLERPGAVPDSQPSRLVDIAEADARAVRVVDEPLTMLLARHDGRWVVVEPTDVAVSGDLAGAFVEALFAAVGLETGVPVAADTGGIGLDERRRIEIDVVDGTRRVFVVGSETPTGTAAYVRDATGAVRIIGRNALVYRELLLDAARSAREPEPPMGPVARRH